MFTHESLSWLLEDGVIRSTSVLDAGGLLFVKCFSRTDNKDSHSIAASDIKLKTIAFQQIFTFINVRFFVHVVLDFRDGSPVASSSSFSLRRSLAAVMHFNLGLKCPEQLTKSDKHIY